ncbi:hypothetical protein [Rhizobium paknamense]|uniref:Flagellar basal body-associated protein FliL n=1 Tax=Rhizobium paknamense TaxID=1206817 RepID=A0ABU0IFI4_9HYPH|nr:hypothetical protein [Rhizobium paknamense]MDQ0457015.1 flagellar basal body-associated protein FliL [Rhizobium paknamense]
MVKIVIAGIWACIVTLVAVYFSVQLATRPAPVEESKAPPTDVIRGEPVTVPYVDDSGVKGYFLGRFTFVVDKEKAKTINIPMTELMTDQLFTVLVGNKIIDLTSGKKLDVEQFRQTILTGVNKRLGDDVVKSVMIEQLDFLAKEDLRETGGKPKLKPAVKIVEGEAPPAAAAAPAQH